MKQKLLKLFKENGDNSLFAELQKEYGLPVKDVPLIVMATRLVEYIPYDEGWIADTPGFSLIDFDIIKINILTDPNFRSVIFCFVLPFC